MTDKQILDKINNLEDRINIIEGSIKDIKIVIKDLQEFKADWQRRCGNAYTTLSELAEKYDKS